MITVTKIPRQNVFSGNPVVFGLETDTDEAVVVEVITGGRSYFTSYFPFQDDGVYRVKMELSGYLQPPDVPLAVPSGNIVASLDGFIIPYTVKIGDSYEFTGNAFRGGISNKVYTRLADNGYDIFSYRLTSSRRQFLFTTRTHDSEVRLRDTELYPFVFLNRNIPLSFVSPSGNTIDINTAGFGPVCVMDLVALRSAFNEQYGEIPDVIKVYASGNLAFSFIISPGKLAEEKYRLRFLNSLGAYELLEVTARASHTSEFGEEDLYNVMNGYDFFEERKTRTPGREKIEVETGRRLRHEMPFILDMIKSEEVYFIWPSGQEFRCRVSTDAFKYRERITEPTSIPLTITELTDERFALPPIDSFPAWIQVIPVASAWDAEGNLIS
ncbi:hypothetical protein IR083_10100 [Dysgonomonas sp. GY75]|uniref:hypothetical protein n=1 Tax=Dysgonomonas sp. GY75 TaxID=2780419 RepID=UPI0018846D4A|nr:hypothetical protein [Dysgonomonas sp. GY75]MBF0649172.1 hypothetical protein [Dysgonomonas sp. GY75]